MKRASVIAVTENGKARYCSTKNYGGIAGVALRLIKNEKDAQGNQVPLFERLDRVKEMDRMEFLAYADYPENADELFSFIEIDADENVIRIDEDMKEERQYHEYPLNLLLEKARKVVGINPYSGYKSLNRDRLYREMRQAVTGGIGRETGQEMGRRGGTKERDAAQEQVMQDGSGQDGNDMPMVQRM